MNKYSLFLPMTAALRLVDLDLPHVWRARELARTSVAALPTGFAALDAQLPGGGWPAAGLVELLQALDAAQGAQHDFHLLLPALAALLAQRQGPLVLVGAPQLAALHQPGSLPVLEPFGPALAARGVPGGRLLRVQAATPSALLWACEQALRCAEVLAVLAWLPRAQADALRRLHVGALEHGKPLWVFRPASAQQQSSAAPLRLLLSGALVDGVDLLQVQVLKRRGPPLEQTLQLPAHGPQLAALLAARRRPRHSTRLQAAKPLPAMGKTGEGRHALDRLVTARA